MEGDEAEVAAAKGTASPSEPAKPSSLATGGGAVQQKKKADDSSSDYNGSNAAEELEESSEDDDKSKEKQESSCLKDPAASFKMNDNKWQLPTQAVSLLAYDKRRQAKFDESFMKEPKNLDWKGIKTNYDASQGDPWIYAPRYYVIVPEEASGVGEHTEVCLKPEGSGTHIWVMLDEAKAMRQKYKEYTDAIKKPAKRQHMPKKKVTSPPDTKRPKTSGDKHRGRGGTKAKNAEEVVASRGKGGKAGGKGSWKKGGNEDASGALAIKSSLASRFGVGEGSTVSSGQGGHHSEDGGDEGDDFLADFFGELGEEVMSEGAKLLRKTFPSVFDAESTSVVEEIVSAGTSDAIEVVCKRVNETMVFQAALNKNASAMEVIRKAIVGQSNKRKSGDPRAPAMMSPPAVVAKSERAHKDTMSVASSRSTQSSPVFALRGLGLESKETGGRDHYFNTTLRVITTLFPVETHDAAHALTLLRMKLKDKDPLLKVEVEPKQLVMQGGEVDHGACIVLGMTLCHLQGAGGETEAEVVEFARGLFEAFGKSPVGRTAKEMVEWFKALKVAELIQIGGQARRYLMETPVYKELKQTFTDVTSVFMKNWTSGRDTSHFESVRHQHLELSTDEKENGEVEEEVVAASEAEPVEFYAKVATSIFMSDLAAMRHMHLFEDITEEEVREKLHGREGDVGLLEYKLCKILAVENFSLDCEDRPIVRGVKAAFKVAVEEAYLLLINPLLDKGCPLPAKVPETLGAITEMVKTATAPAPGGGEVGSLRSTMPCSLGRRASPSRITAIKAQSRRRPQSPSVLACEQDMGSEDGAHGEGGVGAVFRTDCFQS